MFNPSIFNDVLSPITPGPSSSNTCGTYRIGKFIHEMIGAPCYVKMEMAKHGGFDGTFYGMQSDKSFLAGLMGMDLNAQSLETAYDCARKNGLEYEFEFSDAVPMIPTEMGIITIKSTELDEPVTVSAASLGGGEIKIMSIDGTEVDLDGRTCALIWKADGKVHYRKSAEPVSRSELNEIRDREHPAWIGCVGSMYPFSCRPQPDLPFTTAKAMLDYAADKGIDIWEAACDYETALTGLDRDRILSYCDRLYAVAENAIVKGYETESFEGVTEPKSKEVKIFFESDKAIPLGIGGAGSADALSIMEYSNAHGEIVCMPTGGSSGIIVPAIRTTAKALGLDRDSEIKALLTAGAIGIFYYPTHYSGDLGCQAEIGVATSMAAAALASMITDDASVVERAAVLGGESLLGLICDPIEGYVQIPCFIRNMNAVSIAATCANSAAAGVEAGIGLDEMAETMLRVGNKLIEINDLGICKYANSGICK